MADIEVDVKPASAVFIDIPNISRCLVKSAVDLPWKRLSQAIAASELLVGTSLLQAAAYVTTWHVQEKLLAMPGTKLVTFGRGIDLIVRSGDDIDSLIIEDMWAAIAQHQQESIRNGILHYPLQMRFVLVSGDGDYIRTIKKMRQVYGPNLEIELYVFSWLESVNGEYAQIANKVFYLNNIKGFGELRHRKKT